MKKLNLLSITALFISLLFSSCSKFEVVRGTGPIVQETIQAPGSFSGVALNGCFDMEVIVGDTESITLEGQQNIIDRLEIYVDHHGMLQFDLEDGSYRNVELKIYVSTPYADKFHIAGSGDMDVYMDEVESVVLDMLELKVTGSGDMRGHGNFEVDGNVTTDIDGSGDVSFQFECDGLLANILGSGDYHFEVLANQVNASVEGSGDYHISGTAPIQKIKIVGSGDYNAFNFPAHTLDVDILGSGDVKCNVRDQLDIDIIGSGDVYYKGQPSINVQISGSGEVVNSN